jgi:hypothetical protein
MTLPTNKFTQANLLVPQGEHQIRVRLEPPGYKTVRRPVELRAEETLERENP